MTEARILKRSLLAVVAAAALSGCGMHPGAAAVVGSTTITGDEVDGAARALCSANQAGGQATGDLASRGARQAALQFLIDNELSRQFAEAEGVEPDQEQVSATLSQNAQGIEAIPKSEREEFTDLLVGFRESELILAEVGAASLEEQGTATPAPEEAASEGARLRADWAESIEVEVDPRFGTYAEGGLAPASGSLSVPISDTAKAGSAGEPGAAWVASLPASQKCG